MPEDGPPRHPGRILVVEDSPTQAAVLRNLLQRSGHDVTVARSFGEALGELSRAELDIVLTDLHLPGGSGFELCQAIKASPSRPGPSVVIVTADKEPALVLEGLEAGADGFLPKEGLEARLESTVSRVLRRRTAPDDRPGTVQFFGVEYSVRSEGGPLLDVLVGAFENSLELSSQLARSQKRVAETTRGEANLRRLLEALPDALAVLRDGRVVFGNQALLRVMGVASGALLRETALSDRAASERDGEVMRRLEELGRNQVCSDEVRFRLPGGVIGTFVATALPIVFDDEDAVCVVASDVTDVRAMQASLAHSDRLARIGSLAAGVAHEINNPLTYIMHGLDDVKHAIREQDRRSRALVGALSARFGGEEVERIAKEAGWDRQAGDGRSELELRVREVFEGSRRIRDIVAELRSLAQAEHEDRRRPLDLAEICRGAAKLASHQVRHNATVELELEAVPEVFGNEGRLAQVLINLLINAGQALGENDRGVVRLTTRARAGRVLVEVQDNGPGIPADHLQQLCEPFFTTKPPGEGSGLGLWICRRIIEGHGGSIAVANRPEGGATFTIDLPPWDGAESGEEASWSTWNRTVESSETGTLLLVEDEDLVRRSLTRRLSRQHDVIDVASVDEAIAVLAGDAPVDAVLCDLMLGGRTGAELYRWIEENAPHLTHRFVVVSGGAVTREAREFINSGVVRVVAKPVDPNDLDAAVQDVLAPRAEPVGGS